MFSIFSLLVCGFLSFNVSRLKKLFVKPRKLLMSGRLGHVILDIENTITIAVQGRDWMQPLKQACGEKLLAKKFLRKSKGDMTVILQCSNM